MAFKPLTAFFRRWVHQTTLRLRTSGAGVAKRQEERPCLTDAATSEHGAHAQIKALSPARQSEPSSQRTPRVTSWLSRLLTRNGVAAAQAKPLSQTALPLLALPRRM